MKKIMSVYAVTVMIIFVLVNSFAYALDVNLDYNASKDLRQNMLSVTNLHTVYSVAAYGVEKGVNWTSQEKNAWQRTVELIVDSQLAYGLSVLGHEGEHDYAADRNGVVDRKLNWNFYSGSVVYDIATYNNLSGLQKSKLNSAGMAWNNRAAEEVLVSRIIGQRATLPEILWYSANKIQAPKYIAQTSAPDQTGTYGLSRNDVAGWVRNVSGNNFGKMDSLYNDLRTGAIWQGLSLIMPAGASLYYLFTGNIFQVPKIWFDTETELTDAGVLYSLTGLYKHQGITYTLRAGYGKNRINEGAMSQIEAEMKNIPLLIWDLKAKLRAGYTDTLGSSQSIGFGLEKSFKEVAVGVEINKYSGYHRYNPIPDEGLTEALINLKFKF